MSFVNLIFLRFIIWEKFISNLNLVFLIFYFRQQLLRLRKLRWWGIQMMLWRVTWGAHDYGDMGSLTKCIWMPGIHRTAMWFLSFVQLFGWQESVWVVLMETPALGFLFLDMISEGCLLISTLWLDKRLLAYSCLALMIVLITRWNGFTGDSIRVALYKPMVIGLNVGDS